MGVYRRGACVEGKAREGLVPSGRERNMDCREHMSDRNDRWSRNRMNRNMSRYAQSAISVRYLALGVRVGDRNRPAKHQKPDAQKDEEKSPRRISARACHLADHICDYSADDGKLVVGSFVNPLNPP